jgi:hypothetical protein
VTGPVRWRYRDAGGADLGASDVFASREDAEAWLAGAWADLRDGAVAEVVLVGTPDGAEVYRMGLEDQG